MIEKIFDLLLKSTYERNEVILNISKILLTTFISMSVYRWLFGNYEVLNLNEYLMIKDYFITGTFIKSGIAYFFTWFILCFIFTRIIVINAHYKMKTLSGSFKMHYHNLIASENTIQNMPLNELILLRFLKWQIINFSIFKIDNSFLVPDINLEVFEKKISETILNDEDFDFQILLDFLIITFQLIIISLFYFKDNNTHFVAFILLSILPCILIFHISRTIIIFCLASEIYGKQILRLITVLKTIKIDFN